MKVDIGYFPLSQYDQHRHKPFLRGTECYAIPESNNAELTAAPRPNKSTAAVERRVGYHVARAKRQNIFCRFCILNHILHIIHTRLHSNENYIFLEFSQDFSREKYCVFLFGKLRGCSPGLPRAYLETSTLAH